MLTASQGHRRQVFAVRQVRQSVRASADANELFDAIIVGSQFGITNGPVITKTIVTGSFEIEVRQPPAKPPPVQRLAANDARPHPHKWLARVSSIGMLRILHI